MLRIHKKMLSFVLISGGLIGSTPLYAALQQCPAVNQVVQNGIITTPAGWQMLNMTFDSTTALNLVVFSQVTCQGNNAYTVQITCQYANPTNSAHFSLVSNVSSSTAPVAFSGNWGFEPGNICGNNTSCEGSTCGWTAD